MQSGNWRHNAELIATGAVVVGLLLVFFELRQNHSFSRAELSAESGRIFANIREREIDATFAALLSKSRLSPHELTDTEHRQLIAHYESILFLYAREKYNFDRGFFDNYSDFPRISAAYYFGSGYGKAYWAAMRESASPEIRELVDEFSQGQEMLSNHEKFYEEIRRNFQEN